MIDFKTMTIEEMEILEDFLDLDLDLNDSSIIPFPVMENQELSLVGNRVIFNKDFYTSEFKREFTRARNIKVDEQRRNTLKLI